MDLEQEFLKAYDSLSDAIFRHCYFRVSDRDKAKDLTQETFTKTWEYIARGGKVESVKAFLYRVANNLIVDEFRKKKELSLDRLSEMGFEPASVDHRSIKAGAEMRELMETAEMLDKDYRDVVLMRHVEGMSVKEIAEIVGESENLVSVRIHRGLAKLRELLK